MKPIRIVHPQLGQAECMPSALPVWAAKGWSPAGEPEPGPVAAQQPPVDGAQKMEPADGEPSEES